MLTLTAPPVKKISHMMISVIGAALFGYFVYHLIEGDRGLLTMLQREAELHESTIRLNDLRQEREQLEHKVQLMRSNSLDPDLLEEQSRRLLGFTKPNEVVILTPQTKDSSQ